MTIQQNTVVTMIYQLFSISQEGDPILLEEKTADDPLEFIYGLGTLLPKVEENIANQTAGFQKQINLVPEDSFGVYRSDLQLWMPVEKFPQTIELKLGMKFQTQGPDGEVISVIVKEVKEDKVLVDGNHPLAGLNLLFDLKVVRVRQATADEIAKKEVIPQQLH